MNWEKRKNNISCLEITILTIVFLVIFYCLINKEKIYAVYEDWEAFSLTIIQIQATITTLTLSIIALLSGVIGTSYYGVSISTFYLDKKPFILKQKYVIILEFFALAFSTIEYKMGNHIIVFVIFISSLLIILYSILGVYQIFKKGNRIITEEIGDYVKYLMKNDSDYTSVGDNFVGDWKTIVSGQTKEEFQKYCLFFYILVERILNKEKDIETLNSLSENIASYLLNHESEACRLKGIIFVQDYYENIWSWTDKNAEAIATIKEPISLLDRIQSDFYRAMCAITAEQLQNNLNWNFFSSTVIMVGYRIGYNPENKSSYDISALFSIAHSFGNYLKQQDYKSNPIDRKFWEQIVTISDNISGCCGEYDDLYNEAIARRDFNVFRGYLLNGFTDFIKNGVFLDGINNSVSIENETEILRVMLIHSYMYYLAYEETTECIDKELQEKIRELIMDKAVVSSIYNYLQLIPRNHVKLSNSLGENIVRILSNYELRPLHSISKALIINDAIKKYYLSSILYLSQYMYDKEFIGRMIDIEQYSHYLSNYQRPRLFEDMMIIYKLFNPNITEKQSKESIEKLLVSFDSAIKPKYKKKILDRAAAGQEKYQTNDIQEKAGEQIKIFIKDKFLEVFSSFENNNCDITKRYRDVEMLPIKKHTNDLKEDSSDIIHMDLTGPFCAELVRILERDFGIRKFKRRDDMSDADFERLLDKKKCDCFIGSFYTFGVEDYDNYEKRTEYFQKKTCHFLTGVNSGIAVCKDDLFIKLNDVIVEIYSPSIEELRLNINMDKKTHLYSYSANGDIYMDYSEHELQKLIHDEYKFIKIIYDVTIGINQTASTKSCMLIERTIDLA